MIATLPPATGLAVADLVDGYTERPVDMEQFLEDKLYLGDQPIWPEIKRDLKEMYDPARPVPLREACLDQGIGSGKSTEVSCIFAYETYKLECLESPQLFYGLAPGSVIALLNMAPSAPQAKAIIFNEVKQRIEGCRWFRERGLMPDPRVQSELRFPKHIRIFPGNSSLTFPLGYNIKAAVIDEAAFYDDTENADVAEQVHTAISRRMTSRFGTRGGPLVSISSPRYVDDFIERRMEALANDPAAFVRRRATWESKPIPEDTPRFAAVHPVSGDVVMIPIEYQRDFDANPDSAWRDFGAVPSLVLEPYLQDKAAIRAACHGENRSLELAWKPMRDTVYAIHVDLGKKRDAAGIAVGYLKGEEVIVEAAWRVLCTDQLLRRFRGARPEDTLKAGETEIDFEWIRDAILRLHFAGFPIISASYDGWQSADSLQLLVKQGVPAVELSVDRNLQPYDTMKELMYQRRLHLPDSAILKTELQRLELKEGKKVDHTPKGSKDVSDAVAGVCWALIGGQLEGKVEESGGIVTEEEAMGDVEEQMPNHLRD